MVTRKKESAENWFENQFLPASGVFRWYPIEYPLRNIDSGVTGSKILLTEKVFMTERRV